MAFLTIEAEYPPLRVDDDGTARVGKGRITLDLIVEEHESGMTPEEMVRVYDTLALADVYAVIGYYLRNTDSVREYLSLRESEAALLRKTIEAKQPRVTRAELLARRAETGGT